MENTTKKKHKNTTTKTNTKSTGKRPKPNVSSHNACRFGYPFFLSPSDDDAMPEIPNPTPSVRQTPGIFINCCFFFVLCGQKEKKHDSAKFPSKMKTQRHVKSQHCTFSPKSPKSQEYQNHYSKIDQHLQKSIKIYQNQ